MSFEILRGFLWKPVWPPAPAQPAAPEDKPEKGVAVLRGLGGKVIDLTMSETSSWSKTREIEKERTVTPKRVYQKQPDGTVNKENYIDIEEVSRIETIDSATGTQYAYVYADPRGRPASNVEYLAPDEVYVNPDAVYLAPDEVYSAPTATRKTP